MSMSERDSYGDEYSERAQWAKGYSAGYEKGFADAKKKYSGRPHGVWKERFSNSEQQYFECSECGWLRSFKPIVCENCGADMRKEDDEE